MATHFSILAWEIPYREEPGGLQPMGPQSWTQLSDWSIMQPYWVVSGHLNLSQKIQGMDGVRQKVIGELEVGQFYIPVFVAWPIILDDIMQF